MITTSKVAHRDEISGSVELTKHARIRQQQRGIPLMVTALLIDSGTSEKAGDGTCKHFFDKRSRRRLKTYAGQLFHFMEEYLNCYAVVCPEGSRRALVTSSQSFKANHSFATASNVVAFSCSRLMRSSCRLRTGLIPCLTSPRALVRSSRASARVKRRPLRRVCASSCVSPLGAIA